MANHKNKNNNKKRRGAKSTASRRRASSKRNASNGGTALRRPRGGGNKYGGERLPSSRTSNIARLPSMGNAVMIRTPQIGIPNLKNFKTSYVAGTVYVGNGTLGATNKVYYLLNDGAHTLTGAAPVPIAPASADIGATYITAIEQLFRRKHYRELKVYFIALQSSTTNNLTLTVAPVRGPPDGPENVLLQLSTTTTAAQFTQSQLFSYNGVKTIDSFESTMLNLKPFIAGGSGADQCEFAIGANSASNNELQVNTDLLGIIPASFVLAGVSTVAALQGTTTHAIVIEQCCDYLDFTGAEPVVNPIGFKVLRTEEETKAQLINLATETKSENNYQSVLAKIEYLMSKDRESSVISDSEDEQKLDLSAKMTESQLIDKTISKTIKRIKAEESKTTDTPSLPLNVSPGWFGGRSAIVQTKQ